VSRRASQQRADWLGDGAIAAIPSVLLEALTVIFPGSGSAVVLPSRDGAWRVVEASGAEARDLALIQLTHGGGPVLDCLDHELPVVEVDTASTARWPTLRASLLASGWPVVFAVALRARRSTVGAICVFSERRPSSDERRLQLCRTLADVAASAVVEHRTVREAEGQVRELQRALEDRIVVEQAKGVVAEVDSLDPESAFSELVRRAYERGITVRELAREVVAASTAYSPRRPAEAAPRRGA
jgi:transcriptional regulator with GAF, ATPase, and Fis domain